MTDRHLPTSKYIKLADEYMKLADNLRHQGLNPTYAKALHDMDETLSRLTRQRDDARAQMDNATPILAAATRLISLLGTELAEALNDIQDLQIALRERNELIESLQENQ